MSDPRALSRRDLLCVGSAGIGATLAGCLGGESVSLETWAPEAGAWPLARYDAKNTGHNPNATPPRDGIEQNWRMETAVSPRDLVVAHGLVVAYGPGGMVVAPRPNSDHQWRDEPWREPLPTQVAGFGPRDDQGRLHLYAVGDIGHRDGVMMGLVRGWVYHSGRQSQTFWRSYEIDDNGGDPSWLVTSGDTLYTGHDGDETLVAFDADDGDTRWRTDGTYPALADGRLVTSGYDWLSAYEPRTGFGTRPDDGPTEMWAAAGHRTAPAIVEGRVFVGRLFDVLSPDEPTLYGYDAASGETLWEPRHLGDSAKTPAVVEDTGYVGVSNYEDVDNSHSATSGDLVAVDLRDGSVKWRRETEWWHGAVVAGGNGVVISAGGVPEGQERGRLRAYDTESGETLWTVTTPSPVNAVALVESTVYASSDDGSLYGFRSS